MNLIENLINVYERYAEEAGVWHDVVHMRLKALMDFHEGRELTDRQKEMVLEMLDKQRRELEKDLDKIEQKNDLNMEIANHLQQSIDEVNREVKRLDE